ncbi:MAG: DUF3810 family protein [Clostridia bacterium]|nr:DUF3810 family protein [Clostridia bacterium]
MMKNGRRYGAGLLAGLLLPYALACRFSAPFAVLALRRLSRPAMLALHRLTARVPFPAAELAGLLLATAALLPLAMAACRAVLRRSAAPLARWLRSAACVALPLAALLILLWLPPCAATPEDLPAPSEAEPLAWLCGELIDALNEAPLRFSAPDAILRRAPEAAGMPECVVKSARYPEWMRAVRVSGLFVPLTGEALVDAGAPTSLLPFTAVHELMHLAGVADEGAANIAAWERCLAAGGEFAESARLWALRCAMGQLRRTNAAAWQRARDKMKDGLSTVFQQINGDAAPASPGQAALRLSPGDYGALVGYLASRPSA